MSTQTQKPLMYQYRSREEWEAALDKWLSEQMPEDDEFEEDTYDAQGNVCPGGLYDAGGHLIEKWYERIDEDYGQDR